MATNESKPTSHAVNGQAPYQVAKKRLEGMRVILYIFAKAPIFPGLLMMCLYVPVFISGLFAVVLITENILLVNGGVTAEATFERWQSLSDGHYGVYTYVVDSESYTINTPAEKAVEAGTTLEIVYLPSSPKIASVNAFWNLFLVPTIFLVVTIVLIFITITVRTYLRRLQAMSDSTFVESLRYTTLPTSK